MGCYAVLLQQRLLGEMELQWIIRTQANIQTSLEKIRKRVPFVGQEERIIRKRAHRETNLLEVE